jgi:protein subunit release factor A
MDNFAEAIGREARRLFPEGAVQILVARGHGPESDQPQDPVVKVVHGESGISATCRDYASQTKNLAAALIQLRIACDKIAN